MLLTIVFLLFLYRFNNKILKIYCLTFVAVLVFEYFTQALWLNKNLAPWAYLYLDVSWIITLGWSTIIVVSGELVNSYIKTSNVKLKFLFNVIIVSIIGFFAEWVVLGLKIREYSVSALNVMSGVKIGPVPIEALYYIPAFIILVLAFSIYWEENLFNFKENSKLGRKFKK